MTTAAYSKLIDELCELTMISNSSSFYEHANLSVKDVDFTLRHNAGAGEGEVAIYCSYGAIPKANRELILQRLLEANLLLSDIPFSPSLSYNAKSEDVVLCGYIIVENLQAERLLAMMGGMADMALAWRKTYFLGGGQAQAGNHAKTQSSISAAKATLGTNAALLR
jgi:hypothetical protein